MERGNQQVSDLDLAQDVIGYLNFSSGTSDPQFLKNLNELYRRVQPDDRADHDGWPRVRSLLESRAAQLEGKPGAFGDLTQARAVLEIVDQHLLPAYARFHRDLLAHQTPSRLWRPFFLARACEAILKQGAPWDDRERVVHGALEQLNDYVGHRPVATLQSSQRMEPYPHERVRPIPLYVHGAGTGVGRYESLISEALNILRNTDRHILADAYFDPQLLDELALDPRAYDFDHPVNKRPNYQFGQWDPHHLDANGRYRRFVVQQVTLDALLEPVSRMHAAPQEELLTEAAAVLAGTILMASGTSGSSPDSFDSTVSLATLLPRIAAYRDAFYEQFVAHLPGAHGTRLREEAKSGKQALAGARQALNQSLARHRARQSTHHRLGRVYARMRYGEAALRQAHLVSAVSARITCEIECRISAAQIAAELGQIDRATDELAQIEDLLHRGIACGALADPWNILGFGGQFSLFPSPENSVTDHRARQLIELLERIFGLYARTWREAAARGEAAKPPAKKMEELARWWDQFATTTVEAVGSFSAAQAFHSARDVAAALAAWHREGKASGDIAFWRKHVANFASPKAYASVAETLLDRGDLLAAMALLIQWVSVAGQTPLEEGDYSFSRLARRWMDAARAPRAAADAVEPTARASAQPAGLIAKFFDYLEANAEDFWEVPRLTIGGAEQRMSVSADDPDDEPNTFGAAYEDVVYVDSTADGIEGEMLEAGAPPATDFELELESKRLRERLGFLDTVARLWKTIALGDGLSGREPLVPEDYLERWLGQAERNRRGLAELLGRIQARRVPEPSASRDSLLEYDRRHGIKQSLLEAVIASTIDMDQAVALLSAVHSGLSPQNDSRLEPIVRAVLRGDVATVRGQWAEFLEYWRTRPSLYIPLAKGGDPLQIAEARLTQRTTRALLVWLPRLGLLRESCQLIETARLMEGQRSLGAAAVTEFDRVFQVGYRALVEALIHVSQAWDSGPGDPSEEQAGERLVELLEQLTEPLMRQWISHSRTLRLSVLEKVADEKGWKELVSFVERYGRDLFTQKFLNLGNMRAILQQGVDAWLARIKQEEDDHPLALLNDLGHSISHADAVKHVTLVLEAVVENYAEYRDYNTTTTHSDRGDLLFVLLDFVRLRVQYDRVAWHLRPLMWAHELLIRHDRIAAAETWGRALAQRTSEVADTLQHRFDELRKRHGVRLLSVGDQLGKRFVRQLAVDRIIALVGPAMRDIRQASDSPSTGPFSLLEQEADELAREPGGGEVEAPDWILALEAEADRDGALPQEKGEPLPEQRFLLPEEVQGQIMGWEALTD